MVVDRGLDGVKPEAFIQTMGGISNDTSSQSNASLLQQPDRLQTMTSVNMAATRSRRASQAETVVSEITLQANESLFQGPLYPSVDPSVAPPPPPPTAPANGEAPEETAKLARTTTEGCTPLTPAKLTPDPDAPNNIARTTSERECLPDRLRPMTNVATARRRESQARTVVSEITVEANQSLFQGPLYPSLNADPSVAAAGAPAKPSSSTEIDVDEYQEPHAQSAQQQHPSNTIRTEVDVDDYRDQMSKEKTKLTRTTTEGCAPLIPPAPAAMTDPSMEDIKTRQKGMITQNPDAATLKKMGEKVGGMIGQFSSPEKGSPLGSMSIYETDAQHLENPHGVENLPSPSPRPPPSQPGAFAQRGIGFLRDDQSDSGNYTLYNTSEHSPSPSPQCPNVNNDNNSTTHLDSTTGFDDLDESGTGLVQAEPVSEDLEKDLEVAEELEEGDNDARWISPERKKTKDLKHGILGGGLALLVVVVAVVVVALLATRSKDAEQERFDAAAVSAAPTMAPTKELLLSLLPESTQSIIQSDPDILEPQSKAYHWLQNDTNFFDYSLERLTQRFALATLYYSTNGPTWREQGGGPAEITVTSGTNVVQFEQAPPGMSAAAAAGGGGPPPGQGPPPQGSGGGAQGPPAGGGGGGSQGPPAGGGGGGGQGPPSGGGQGGGGPPSGGGGQRPPGGPSGGQGELPTITVMTEKWLDYESNECNWFTSRGKMCQVDNETITEIRFLNNGIGGTIPGEVATLSSLQHLHLSKNNVAGPIATELGLLTNLQKLRLDSNKFAGGIPPELGQLSNSLTILQLRVNKLVGNIPRRLMKLTNLIELTLAFNNLSGAIPEDIGNLSKLHILLMKGNSLSGTIPTTLGALTDVVHLNGQQNSLTGTLPTELAMATSLLQLRFSDNELSGQLPSELALLPSLWALNLDGNTQITGTIPAEWELMNQTLLDFSIQGTQIEGTIPTVLCAMPRLNFDCSATLCGCSCPCPGH